MHEGNFLPHRQARPLASRDPREVAAAGHSVGGHTWSHANLGKLKGDKAVEEIEKGFSAVKLALGATPRPSSVSPPSGFGGGIAYLGTRNIAIFSHDLDSFDFKMRKPEDVIKSVMTKLEKKGKGIILMHDFQQATATAIPTLLGELKTKGYKVVFMRAKFELKTIAEYDALVEKDMRGMAATTERPMSSVIKTIEETPAPAQAAQKK